MKSFFSRRLFLLVCIIFTGCISTAATSVYTADVGFPANVMTTDANGGVSYQMLAY